MTSKSLYSKMLRRTCLSRQLVNQSLPMGLFSFESKNTISSICSLTVPLKNCSMKMTKDSSNLLLYAVTKYRTEVRIWSLVAGYVLTVYIFHVRSEANRVVTWHDIQDFSWELVSLLYTSGCQSSLDCIYYLKGCIKMLPRN